MRPFLVIICMSLGILQGCIKAPYENGATNINEDFEQVNTPDDLAEGPNWTYTQVIPTTNSIKIDTQFAHSGQKSVHFTAEPTGTTTAKCDIAHNRLTFYEGESIRFSGWFFLKGPESAQNLFLFDLEEDTELGAGPGIRVFLGENDRLVLDRSKMGRPSFHQPENGLEFPKDQWVELVMEMKLSRKKKGSITLWQDQTPIFVVNDIQTLPTEILYLIQGTKGILNNFQVGITANSSTRDVELWVDDVLLEKM